MEPDDFLEFVHQIDHFAAAAQSPLGAALQMLPGRKLILTNGTRAHPNGDARAWHPRPFSKNVFDIVAGRAGPKARRRKPYDRFLARHGIDPQKAAIV